MLGVIMYRVLVSIPLFQSEIFRSEAQSIASMSGAVVNLVLIMVLGQVYQRLAGILNDWGKWVSHRGHTFISSDSRNEIYNLLQLPQHL